MDGLSPETRALLARADGADAMPDERRRAVRMRVAGALGIAAPLAAASASSASQSAHVATGWTARRMARWMEWAARWMRWGHGAPWGAAAITMGGLGVAGVLAVTAVALATRSATMQTEPARKGQLRSVQAVPMTAPQDETTAPQDETTAPQEETTAPQGATAPQEVTAAPPMATTPPPEEPVRPPSADVTSIEAARAGLAVHAHRAAPRAQTAAPATAPPVLAPAAAPQSDVGAEAHLLTSAQTALAYGNPGQALSFLDEHDARFPAGTLALESHSLRVTALCASGHADEARAEATRLRARFPAAGAASSGIGAGASCAPREP